MTAVGDIVIQRRYWKCVCGAVGSYAADDILGIEGERTTKTVQKHLCRLGADQSFAKASEHMHEMLGIDLSAETVRKRVEEHGKKMAEFQTQDMQSIEAFQQAKGEVEFTVDASKVNTREEGWKDLKIAVASKREAGEPITASTPEELKEQRLPKPEITLAIAKIAKAKEFCKEWRAWLKRLGVVYMASVVMLGDGASWIWKAAMRVLTGCKQVLDYWHACQHIHKCAERIHGEGTPETISSSKRGRSLLLSKGWAGVCEWIGELLGVEDEKERERRRKATDKAMKYFIKHIGRLPYAEQLAAGRVIGSGQVEGQAKTMSLRLKARGSRWKLGNVRAMAGLVCVRNSSQWSSYWALLAV